MAGINPAKGMQIEDPSVSTTNTYSILHEAISWIQASQPQNSTRVLLHVLSRFFGVEHAALYFRRADRVSWKRIGAVAPGKDSVDFEAAELTPFRFPGSMVLTDFPSPKNCWSILPNKHEGDQTVLWQDAGPNLLAVAFDRFEPVDSILIAGMSRLFEEDEIEILRLMLAVAGQRLALDERQLVLEEDHTFLMTLINLTPDLVYQKDREGRYVRVNRAFATFLGVKDPKEVVGRSDFDFFREEDARTAFRKEKSLLETGEALVRHQERFTKRDGNSVWLSTTEVRSVDSEGATIGLVGIARDITERKISDEAFAQRRELLEVTLNSVADGVITVNEEGLIVLMNPVAERLLGFTFEKAYGRDVDECVHLFHDAKGDDAFHPVAEVLGDRGRLETLLPVYLRTIEGEMRSVLLRAAVIHGGDDRKNLAGAVLALLDVTRMQRMEQDARKAEKLESLGLFAGGIAHDFNNLLTAILGNITLTAHGTHPGDSLLEPLHIAEKAALRARDLATQLLVFSKGGETQVKHIDGLRVLRESVEFALHGSEVEARYTFPPDLPALEVDESQIRQVFENLALNARQAMQNRGVFEVTGELVSESAVLASGGQKTTPSLRITFRDTGPGIEAESIDKIFDPYFTTKRQGTGLGLAICRSVLQRHGGSLTVENHPESGACFTAWLPVSADTSTPLPASIDPASTVEQQAAIHSPINNQSILVLDDEPAICDLILRCGKALGFRVETTNNECEFLQKWTEAQERGDAFDLVLVDIGLADGASGVDAVEKLRAHAPEVVAVISSGSTDDPAMQDPIAHGFAASLLKPYSISNLRTVLESALQKGRRTDAKMTS